MAYKNSNAQAAISVLLSIGPTAASYTGNPTAITGDTTTGSNIITSPSSTVGLSEGNPISGTGIPADATIATLTPTFTISENATATGTAVALSITPFIPIFEMKEAPVSGQKWNMEDITNFQSGKNMEWLKTLLDSGKVTVQGNRVSTDPGQVALKAAFFDTAPYMFQITLPLKEGQVTTGDSSVFAALVEQFDEPLSVGKAITVSVTLQRTGAVTYTEGA